MNTVDTAINNKSIKLLLINIKLIWSVLKFIMSS